MRLEGKTRSEFRDFVLRMSEDSKNRFEVAEISRYIEKIGSLYGAKQLHFRDEDAADGLPPPYHQFLETDNSKDFGLRLYCIRLSPSVVILLNGDRKTALKAKDCPRCFPHFDRARKLAKKINQAILENAIEIDEENKDILIDNDFELSI